MEITRTSMLSGVTRTLDIPVTREQLIEWERGALIQDAMPNLTPEQREFIMTGSWGDEWKGVFSDED